MAPGGITSFGFQANYSGTNTCRQCDLPAECADAVAGIGTGRARVGLPGVAGVRAAGRRADRTRQTRLSAMTGMTRSVLAW